VGNPLASWRNVFDVMGLGQWNSRRGIKGLFQVLTTTGRWVTSSTLGERINYRHSTAWLSFNNSLSLARSEIKLYDRNLMRAPPPTCPLSHFPTFHLPSATPRSLKVTKMLGTAEARWRLQQSPAANRANNTWKAAKKAAGKRSYLPPFCEYISPTSCSRYSYQR